MLALHNGHPRDKDITFLKENHIYEINGDKSFTSTTTFIHLFFPHFDSVKVIKKMRSSPNWVNSPYFGMTDQEITDKWDKKCKHSAEMGTMLHEYIEDVYNQEADREPPDVIKKEISLFNSFQIEVVDKLGYKPYRTEWYIYDEDIKIAGSIDMVFLKDPSDDSHVSIFDWKRVIALKECNPFQIARKPIQHLDDCNFNIYSLQLNMYKYILETKYNKILDEMKLVVIHPDNENYIVKDVPVMSDEIRAMIEHRKLHITSGAPPVTNSPARLNRRPVFL